MIAVEYHDRLSQDPVLLSTLSEAELALILNNDEIAPPPTQEEIFGEQINAKINELTEDQKRLQVSQDHSSTII